VKKAAAGAVEAARGASLVGGAALSGGAALGAALGDGYALGGGGAMGRTSVGQGKSLSSWLSALWRLRAVRAALKRP
jgi:hypothetical protein